jgi:uncharacterized membrane protein YhaH (DUF805 family)
VPAHRDVVISILGAAAALAGLTLVFLGMVISVYQNLSEATSERQRSNYRLLSALVLAAFVASILAVALATVWLISFAEARALYVAVIVVFMFSLALLVMATVMVFRRLLARR